jgi:hypothetical protein
VGSLGHAAQTLLSTTPVSAVLLPLVLTLGLELRYKIYGFASQRPNGSYLILKEYLEKEDPAIGPPVPPPNIDITDAEEEEIEDGESGDEVEDESEDEDDGAGDNDEDEGEEDEETILPVAAPPPPSPTGRYTKYRHILSTIQLSHCPPPVNLLQSCSQLRDEALNEFLNTCSLDINVSQSFQHHSFFVETMGQLTLHPFSPLKQMRKINLTIVWDSEWLSSKLNGSPPELDSPFYFEYYFDKRIRKIVKLLRASPKLRTLTINWHDSQRTPESEAFMNERLVTFLDLTDKVWVNPQNGVTNNLDVSCTQHFGDAGSVYTPDTLIGNLRSVFDSLLANGMGFR